MFFRIFILIIASLANFSCNSDNEVNNNQVTSNKVTVGDITFYFEQEYSVGQYVDGQWWVHNNGKDVVITAITPISFNDGGRVKHGAEVNPVNSSAQGFDGLKDTGADSDMPYDASKNIDPGATGESLILGPDNSVIKAISKGDDSNRPIIDQAAILTIVSENPTTKSFRPPYAGTDKSLVMNVVDLNYDVLGHYEPLVNTPDINTYLPYISGVWLDHNSEWTQREIHPESSMPIYGRELARFTSEIGLQLQLNYTNAEKEQALIAMVQYAIDLYGVLQLPPIDDKENYYWYNNGGHNQGRKLPLLIAGKVLNHQGMLDIVDAGNGNNLLFQEDQQTFYITQEDIDRELTTTQIEDGVQAYQQTDLNVAEWATRPWDKRSTTLNADWGASYRNVNGCNTIVTALTVHMMGAVDSWNHDAFFDYSDRYFNREGNNSTTDSFNGNRIRTVTADLWKEYRDNFGNVYTEDISE